MIKTLPYISMAAAATLLTVADAMRPALAGGAVAVPPPGYQSICDTNGNRTTCRTCRTKAITREQARVLLETAQTPGEINRVAAMLLVGPCR